MTPMTTIASEYPILAALWHPTKNGELTPEMVSPSSSKKIWALGNCSHEWEVSARNFIIGEGKCPYCEGYKVLSGFNDFTTTHPEESLLWHPTKNDDLTPDQFFAGSNKKVWWQCSLGHEWQTVIVSITGQKTGCSVCSGRIILDGFNDLATVHPEFVTLWHPTKNGELKPTMVSAGSNKKFWWQCSEGHERHVSVNSVIASKSACPYCAGARILSGFSDFATVHPELAALWHPTKNGELTPNQIGVSAKGKVWWFDEQCNHEWETNVANLIKTSGCIFCVGRACLNGFNDLATTHPLIAAKWHPTKNGELSPYLIKAGSSKKVWWRCQEGHEWSAVINTQTDTSCPYCYGRYVISGENDLATKYPKTVAEWHPTKNGDMTPQNTMPYTPKRIWWICELGHEWKSSPNSRFAKNDYTGCPYCAGKKVLAGFNDLVTTHPEVAAQWHPTKNGELKPTDIGKGHDPYIWWICDKGHEWKIPTYARTGLDKTGCPTCSGKNILVGFNDLNLLNPTLAAQWHPTLNKITPNQVSIGSQKKIWWLCDKGHKWQASVSNRHRGRGCAKCTSGEKASKAEKALSAYIESLGVQVVLHSRKLLKGKELDIYVPEKNIAIEFNGVYWHTELHGGKGKSYHRDKWLACKEAGVQLIQVWEDEWEQNPDQIKRMLAHKLGFSNQRKVFARKTKVMTLTNKQAADFLDVNHVQGYASGSHYLALVEKNDPTGTPLAVLVLKKEAGTDGKVLNIIRYATSANVVGGFTKLLSHATTEYQPESFITFADHCVSDGGLYENNGFVVDKELAPDYMYLFKKERRHKFGFRLKRFRDDPDLLWEEGLTERELAVLNGLDRIWDAGKTRYRYTV